MSSLGETLQQRRRDLGLSIEQVEAATRIRSRLIRALENGEYDVLPDPGYVRGYISSYARLLQLDPLPLLNIYKAESGARRPDLDLPQVAEAVARTGEQHAVPARSAVILVALVAVVSLLVWGGTRLVKGPEETLPEPAPVGGSAGEQVTGEDPSGTDDEDGLPQETALEPFTLQVSIDPDAASWLRVTVDGQKAYEGVLAGGQSKKFEVSEDASVRIGKPSAVTVLRDGEEVRIPAGDTPVVELEATAQE